MLDYHTNNKRILKRIFFILIRLCILLDISKYYVCHYKSKVTRPSGNFSGIHTSKKLIFGFEKTKRAVVNALNLICKCISKRIYIYVNLSEEGFDSLRENQNFSLFHSTDGNLKP